MDDNPVTTFREPAVLWRLQGPEGDRARATLIPGVPESTLVFFLNDRFERGQNVTDWAAAITRADEMKRRLLEEGWTEE